MQRITVLGLGIIGGAWAKNLHDDGLHVRAWNRSPKSVDYFEDDLASAVHDAEMIMIVVADPPAVASILDVIGPQLKPGQLVAQSSTISAEWTLKFAKRVQETGALFLEAPFTGSKLAAEARKTVYYLGGDDAVVEKARPVLQRLASSILHIGPLGSASSLKLAMNLNIALSCEALSESLTFARAAGIPDAKFFDALHLNVARSGFSDLKEPKFRAGDYSPQFSLKHMDKDMRLVLETAGPLDLPGVKTLKALYEKAIGRQMGDDDFIGAIRVLAAGSSDLNKHQVP
jgi:3-hydroxyisobutyrate dehydrogenase-like beta-hydroxyacid dehydrogenase